MICCSHINVRFFELRIYLLNLQVDQSNKNSLVKWRVSPEGDAYINGLVQGSSNSIASTLELLLSCTKPSISPGKILELIYKVEFHFLSSFSVMLIYHQRNCRLSGKSYCSGGRNTNIITVWLQVLAVITVYCGGSRWSSPLVMEEFNEGAADGLAPMGIIAGLTSRPKLRAC